MRPFVVLVVVAALVGACGEGSSGATDASALLDGPRRPDAGAIADARVAADGAPPVAVVLTNATATFSQSGTVIYDVGRVIDGQLADRLGWALFPVRGNQTAAFETTEDTAPYATGTRLVFRFFHSYVPDHALGKLRLAVTDASRDRFADGNEGLVTPGDVGAPGIWTVLQPIGAVASTDALMTIGEDGSVLAQDLDSDDPLYTVIAETPLTRLTGVRLEALADDRLPMGGPGLASNGNVVLTELTLEVSAAAP